MVNLVILFLSVIGFFLFFAAMKPTKINRIIGSLFLLSFLGSLTFAILNEAYHYGMKEVETTQKVALNQDTKMKNVVFVQKVGTKKEESVVAYPTKKGIEKTTPSVEVKNHIQKEKGKEAFLEQKTTYWDYNNKVIRFFFHFPKKEREVTKVQNDFYLPTSWHVIEK